MLVQAERVERSWPWFRAMMGCRQPTPEQKIGRPATSCTQLSGFGDLYLAPRTDPKMAERNLLEKYAREDAERFPTVPRTPAGLRSNVAEGGGHDPHTQQGASGFRGRDEPMPVSPSNVGGGGRIRTCTTRRSSPDSSRLSTPHARLRKWRSVEYSKLTPLPVPCD
jgi:hypothetical protein